MKKITLFFVLSFLQFPAFSQFLGGEITWVAMQGSAYTTAQQGKFKIILKVYKDCYTSSGSTTPYDSVQYLRTTVPGKDTLALFLALGYPKDVSPNCNSNQSNQITCGGTNYQVNSGARKEFVFTTDHFFPNGVQLTGMPPLVGWTFYWNGGMRNPANNLIGNHSARLKTIMYPFGTQNMYPAFDNSPTTMPLINPVLCAGNPYQYLMNYRDKELDSTEFLWSYLTDSTNSTISSYATNYSQTMPLPSSIVNPNNQAASLFYLNGNINFTCFTPGTYACCIRIPAYKCGHLVAEIFKEIYFTVLNCPSNNPPIANFINPNIEYVIAGQLYNKIIQFTDNDTFADGSHQTVSINAAGSQFGTNFLSNTSGCLNPPCATLNPAPIITDTTSSQTLFQWRASCNPTNIGCGKVSSLYYFDFLATDNFCPAPATKVTSLILKVIPSPLCASVNINGSVELFFRDFKFDGTNHTYKILRRNINDTAFTQIDSINSSSFQISYIDLISIGNDSILEYKIERAGWDISLIQQTQLIKIYSTFLPLLNAYKITFNMPFGNCDAKKYAILKKVGTGNWTTLVFPVTIMSVDTISDLSQITQYKFILEVELGPDTISSPNICQSISSIDSFVPPGLGIEEHTIHNCQIFPNPAKNSFYVNYQSQKSQTCELSIFDANGKLFERRKFQFVAGENQIKMDLNFQYKGLLMIEILTEDDVVWRKLMKE